VAALSPLTGDRYAHFVSTRIAFNLFIFQTKRPAHRRPHSSAKAFELNFLFYLPDLQLQAFFSSFQTYHT